MKKMRGETLKFTSTMFFIWSDDGSMRRNIFFLLFHGAF